MFLRHGLLAVFMAVMVAFSALPAFAAPLSLGSATFHVPQGTLLPVVMETPLDARESDEGDPVTARLNQDLFYRAQPNDPLQVILPKGSTLRGRVTHVKRPKWFSKGGWLAWQFDQVILPTGELQLIRLDIAANNDDAKALPAVAAPALATEDTTGNTALYQDPGVAPKLRNSVSEGATSFQTLTKAGMQTGERLGGTTGKVIAAPLAVIGGAVVGAGTVAREGVKSLVLPGESVVIDPGYQLLVDFGGAFDIAAQ